MMRETIDTTYADLRPTDLVIDKSGQAWPIAELQWGNGEAWFWLCDPVTKVKMHSMAKTGSDAVKVSRLPTQADEAAKLEAEFPETAWEDDPAVVEAQQEWQEANLEEAVAAVEEIGGTVEAEVTADEVDAAAAATEDAPITLPAFEDMTPLEARSHLYLLHGLYGSDVTGKAELVAIHNDAHRQQDAGSLQSRYVPHVHKVA